MISRTHIFIGTGIASLALAACLSGTPALAQDQQQTPPDQPAATEQQPPSDQAAPPIAQQVPPANQSAVPSALTLSEGTVIPVRAIQQLSSDKSQVGDRFSATLEQPLVANGWVVARRGQIVTGRVVVAQKASHGGNSQLGVELVELTLADGQILPVSTELSQSSAGTPRGRDASIVATTTGIGAVIGAAAGGGTGAAIGAGLGATAGAATVLSTRGNPTIIYSEQLLTFRLEAPLAISTERSQVAFQPVRQSDYSRGDQDAYARPRLTRGAYYAGPGYYAPYPYWYGPGYYPVVPYVGFYGSYGGFYGPRFRGGFRGFRR